MNKLSWFGTVTSVLGSFAVALHFFVIGYCLFLCGAVAWLTVGFWSRNWSLVTLNGFFLAANLIGLYNAI